MHTRKTEYEELLVLLGDLRRRQTVHNTLNTIANFSPDIRLRSMVGALLHSFQYTSTDPLKVPLGEMNACKEHARLLRLYCQKMREQAGCG